MPIPTVDQLKWPTLRYLRRGVTDTDAIRRRMARDFNLNDEDRNRRLSSPASTFTNNHAWALVRLQQEGLIHKTGQKTYELTDWGTTWLEEHHVPESHRVEPPKLGDMPVWAKIWISRANRQNGPDGPSFTEEDLMELWRRCDGRCAITGLEFSEEKVGAGAAKRAFAPSIDKTDPSGVYEIENCRLVMVAVNFALNAWGLEVYLTLARAAVRQSRSAK